MPARAHSTPLLIENGRAVRLTRVPFDEHPFDEAWLQELLFQHPALIPVQDIEPVFAPLIPVARELPTPSGPLDIFYVSPEGYPTLVETKLWRNPEARRQVVAQVIDYATQLSRWSYDDLLAAVKSARRDAGKDDPFVALMETHTEEWDPTRFIDTISRSLRAGRMLLLIVGDGIHESVEHMAETLSGTPQLGFSLGLVEMALYRPSERSEPLFVQPRIVARTREVVRAIVEISPEAKAAGVVVALPRTDKPTRDRLTKEAFFERLEQEESSGTSDELCEFLTEAESRHVKIVARQASLSLHYFEPSREARFSFGSVYLDARVDMFYVVYYFQAAAIEEQIGQDYLDDVARLVPRARVDTWDTKSGPASAIRVDKRHVTVQELLRHRTEWLAAIERMILRINDAAKTADPG